MRRELRASILELKDGILMQECIKGVDHNLDDAIENVKTGLEITNGERYPSVVDARNLKSQSKEAQDYYAGAENLKLVKCIALLVGNPFTKMFGNIFLKLKKPLYPFKIFTAMEDALEWAKEHKN